MLAGDLCGVEATAVEPVPSAEGSSLVAQNASEFYALDAAGGTRDTAANLGEIQGTIRKSGRLSWFDRTDMVRFEVSAQSNVRIALDQLNRDADLYVLDGNGTLIGSSARGGRTSEALFGTLPQGEYFIAVSAVSFSSISYRLSVSVDSIAPPPETSTPEPENTAPEPETASPVPTAPDPSPATPPVESTQPVGSPNTVQPLAEVSYYGGSREWNLNAVNAPEAWAAGYTGQGVTVAVIDTGVDLDHPDLVSSLYVNPGEIAGNGIDDDGNGYVDDVSGYDFVSGDARPDDGNGHGTHVAGTIAAANNGVGVTGVAPDAKILPIRVLNNSGSGSDSSVAAGIRYAAEIGAEIINLSLGGSASSRIASAIEYATSLGSLVIAAAGNESAANPSFPARHSSQSTSVLSVGAFDSQNGIASFSNEVGSSGSIQIDAPGVGVYSTYIDGRYASLSGTSMASPHVAGVAALTLSANPNLTSSELRELLATGTVGQASGSDSIGQVSTLQSVAYAAAGLTTAGTAVGTDLSASTNSSTSVRATRGIETPRTGVVAQVGTRIHLRSTSDESTGEVEADLFVLPAAVVQSIPSIPARVASVDQVFANGDALSDDADTDSNQLDWRLQAGERPSVFLS